MVLLKKIAPNLLTKNFKKFYTIIILFDM